jgi:hypothetical protein
MLRMARKRARRAGVACTLTVADIVIPTHCPVLGIPLRSSHRLPSPGSPSLDRVDRARGFTKGNVVVVSLKAVSIRGGASVAELRKVADYFGALGSR